MDADLKAKWVTALRSGKYKQAKGKLRAYRGGYCCLGVLCDVNGLKFVHPDPTSSWVVEYVDECGDVQGEDADLPQELLDGFGLSLDEMYELIARNDGHDPYEGTPHTFEEIADYIEKNL